MTQTHLRLGDQAHVGRVLGSGSAQVTALLLELERELDAHGAGIAGAGGAALREALAVWLEAAHGIPKAIETLAERLGTVDSRMVTAQADQAATFDRVARALRGPA